MLLTTEMFEKKALSDRDHHWELYCGRLVEKPPMTWEHNDLSRELWLQIRPQLDRAEYLAALEPARLRRPGPSYFIPDLIVVEREALRTKGTGRLESYDDPALLVVEVWSPSTGTYDVMRKLPEYRARGDQEIWLIHPNEQRVRAWVRRADGGYAEAEYTGGRVRLSAIPHVEVDLDALFTLE